VVAPEAIVPTPYAAPAAAAPVAAADGTDVEATVGSGDPAAATYTFIVSEHVGRVWQPPGQGRVVVNARVLRSRFVRDVVVVRPSGNPLFDMSAVRAIQEAVQYPPFLPLMREEYVDIVFTFTGKGGLR
jgi:TonB family protein